MAERSDFDGEISPTEEEQLLRNDVDGTMVSRANGKTDTAADANHVVIVLAGKSGAGKSTLFKTLLGEDMDVELSAKPMTTCAQRHSITKHGVTISIVDTPGFVNKKVKDAQRKLDLLVYCMSVSPGSRFHDDNPDIMRKLQEMYGKEIWKHCVIAFTFSNVALDRSKKGRTEDKGIEQYKQYIEEYTRAFKEELHVANV